MDIGKLSEALRITRNTLGCTQREVSELLFWDYTKLNRLENYSKNKIKNGIRTINSVQLKLSEIISVYAQITIDKMRDSNINYNLLLKSNLTDFLQKSAEGNRDIIEYFQSKDVSNEEEIKHFLNELFCIS